MSRRTLDCFEACMLSIGGRLPRWESEYDDKLYQEYIDEETYAFYRGRAFLSSDDRLENSNE